MNHKAFADYLATGNYTPTEDAAPKKDPTLAAHDKRFHPQGYKDGDSCKFRDALARGDDADKLDDALEDEYAQILGAFFNKVFDNKYGKQLKFNGYRTKSLDEVRIAYTGDEPLSDVAEEISKVAKPFGYSAKGIAVYSLE